MTGIRRAAVRDDARAKVGVIERSGPTPGRSALAFTPPMVLFSFLSAEYSATPGLCRNP